MSVRPPRDDDDVMAEAKPSNVCPECKAGKHWNCDGGAWDFDDDEPTVCFCAANEHQVPQ